MDIYIPVLHDFNLVSITVRLVLAAVIGGVLGLERSTARHPAGLRTYAMVCLGATLVMLTNEYICDVLLQTSDPARLGAQVVTGVGFLGAGTILVAGRQKIRGLTTAAGLWVSACLGLALGIGFYFGALVAAILVFLCLTVLRKVEAYFNDKSSMMLLYIEAASIGAFGALKSKMEEDNIEISENSLSQSPTTFPSAVAFYLTVKLPKGTDKKTRLRELRSGEDIYLIEEI